MKSHIIILLLLIACVTIDSKKLLRNTNSNHNYISGDVYNQNKIHLNIDDTKHPDDTDGNQDYISGGEYNLRKIHLKQDNYQPEYYEYNPPCPVAEDIAPCVCIYHRFNNVLVLDLDCSAVESEDQLRQIFSSHFPSKIFRKFTIKNNNNLKVLGSSIFNGISFEEIDIEKNEIEVIEAHALDSCYETASHLRFSLDKITHFPFDELSQFSKMKVFYLKRNPISMVPAVSFSGLTTLEILTISGDGRNAPNIVGTFENLPNINAFWLSNNNLTTLPTNFINTGSSNLKTIFLYNNNIVSVEPGAFKLMGPLYINLSYNSLSTLEEAVWRPVLEAGGVLFAGDNPLSCGCDIAWLFGEDQLINHVTQTTSCSDGGSIHEVDQSIFDSC